MARNVNFARFDGAPYVCTVVSEFIINSWPSPFIHSYAYLYTISIYTDAECLGLVAHSLSIEIFTFF